MKVALTWWGPSFTAGGRTQAIRGNVSGFRDAGHVVDVYWREELGRLRESADDYDLIVTPYVDTTIDTSAHVHLQIGGSGDPDAEPDDFTPSFQAANTISVLDPRLALHFCQFADLDLRASTIIPNAPNLELFPRQPFDEAEGTVLCPKIDDRYKRANILNKVASHTRDVSYRAHAPSPPPALMPNVTKYGYVPLSAMPRLYAEASMVFNPSHREGLPNVAFEAFLSGRPFVTTPNGIGLLQTIPKDELDPGDFGRNSYEFIETYRGLFNRGDHYVTAAPEQLTQVIPDLLYDRDTAQEMAISGLEWVEQLGKRYTWEAKAEAIVGQVDV